jgi:Tol biopolymer transport system component
LLTCPVCAHATSPGANGSIAFERRPAGVSHVAVVTPNGALERQLTTAEGGAPAWSPDGSRIAFDGRTTTGRGEIFTMAADGSDITQLTDFGAIFPSWSPDGTKVAFATFTAASNYDVFVMNANGTNPTNLTSNSAEDIWPTWSPDGTRIAFQSNRDGDTEIYVVNADGTGVTDVSNRHLSQDDEPDWSPDGTKIAFVSGAANLGINVYEMNANGSDATQLTTSGLDLYPSWSPDGKEIAFVSDRDFNDEIYTMHADGTNPTRLTHNDYDDLFPRWQPLGVGSLTETTLAAPTDTLVYGQSTSFTAAVRSGGATPTGLVQFAVGGQDDGAPIALDALGQAHHEPDFLVNVGEVVAATYGGDARWGWSVGESALHVLPAPTTTALAVGPNPVPAGGTATATVTVTNTPTDIAPFGSVQFAINGAPLGPRLELDENGQVVASLVADVPAGDYRVSVDYLDDTAPIPDFVPSSAALVEHVVATASAGAATSAAAPATPSRPLPAAAARAIIKRAVTQFAARLSRALRSRGLAALRQPGPVFVARTPGRLAQHVYELSAGRRTLLASGRHTFAAPASSRLRLRLTAAAKRLMRRARAVRVEIDTSFTPAGGMPIAVTQRLSAGRREPRAVIALRARSARADRE